MIALERVCRERKEVVMQVDNVFIIFRIVENELKVVGKYTSSESPKSFIGKKR